MEILIAYSALIAFLAAIVGLFIPQKLVFWCNPDDRSRAMAFTVYLTLSAVLAVVFIAVVPDPPTAPSAVEKVVPKPRLTEAVFLKEVRYRLGRKNDFQLDGMQFTLLDFGRTGAGAQLLFNKNPEKKVAVEHATQVVKTMNEVFKAYGWKLQDPILVTCQVHTWTQYSGETKPKHHSMGFARYIPKTKKIKWIDYNR